MIFSPNFKQFSRISLLAVALLIIQPRKIRATDPITFAGFCCSVLYMAATSLVVSGVIGIATYLLTESKTQQEYDERHAIFYDKNNLFFLELIESIKNNPRLKNSELKILSNHEMYRYESFIEAIKESCPEYAQYIKELYAELVINYKKRKVRGFKRIYKTNIISRELPGHNPADDYFEFYELIKTLYQEVLVAEQLEELRNLILSKNVTAINELWNTIDQTILYEALNTIGCQEKNDAAYYVALNLITTCNKESSKLHLAIAIILLTKPQITIQTYEEALHHMRRALELNPEDATIANELALAELLYKELTHQNEITLENK